MFEVLYSSSISSIRSTNNTNSNNSTTMIKFRNKTLEKQSASKIERK